MILNKIVIYIVSQYQRFISPGFSSVCRFSPTCSEYAKQSFMKYSFGKGSLLSLKRILKCHPFHPGGFDPVP